MKTKDVKDLQTKTQEELKKLLKDARQSLMTLRLDHQQNKLENTRSIFTTRKQIAVLQTIMREKMVNEAKAAVKKVVEAAKEVKGGKNNG